MATKFKVWIDNVTDTNIQDYSTYSGDTQRQNGFQPGTVASSIRVNTALRSATLVTAALMSVLLGSSNLDASSDVSDVSEELMEQWDSKANLDSPSFQGIPLAPTPAAATNDSSIATTKFVHNVLDNAVPKYARIASGDYTGSGTYGQANPTSITLPNGFTPKIIFIGGSTSSASAVYMWGATSFPAIAGSSVYQQTASTSGMTVTKYYARARLLISAIISGKTQYYGKYTTTTTSIFGTNQFYRATSISGHDLGPDATLGTYSTIGDMEEPTIYDTYYYQPKSDYEGATGNNIFRVTSYTIVMEHYSALYFVDGYDTSNTYLNDAITGTIIEVTSSTTSGWQSGSQYYYDNIHSEQIFVPGDLVWYNSSSATGQLNTSGVKYYWIAIS